MRIQLSILGLLGLMIMTASDAIADVKLNRYFSDNMVLQREKPVKVWGTANAGAKVTVAFGDQKKTATADKDGNWVATLDPMKANAKGQTLQVTGGGKVKLSNVLVGDVWFFGRQSYIDVSLASTTAGKGAAGKYKATDRFRAIVIKTMPARKRRYCIGGNAQ